MQKSSRSLKSLPNDETDAEEDQMFTAVRSRLSRGSTSSAPKYQMLRDAILEAIASGEWAVGAQLPTESALSLRLPFSLGTVQRAYGELVKSRVVVRSRGRGSFVAPLHRQLAEPWHCRFLADDGTVLPVYPEVVGWETVEPKWPGQELFGKDAVIVRIDRRLSIGKEFDVLSRFFARESVAATILGRPHEQFQAANFKAMLLRELGMPIGRIVQTVRSVRREAWVAAGMQSRPHILLEATAYAGRNDVAYFQEFFIPDNDRKLLFDTDFHL